MLDLIFSFYLTSLEVSSFHVPGPVVPSDLPGFGEEGLGESEAKRALERVGGWGG